MRGLTGGEALNKSLQYSVGAFQGSAIVNEGIARGADRRPDEGDPGQPAVLKGFAASGPSLASLVHTFNATMSTLASRQQDLEQTIELLPPCCVAPTPPIPRSTARSGRRSSSPADMLPGSRARTDNQRGDSVDQPGRHPGLAQ